MIERPRVGVGVLIIKENKILLGPRNPKKHQETHELHEQGTWSAPGGKVDFQEALINTAKRELKEETGLIARKLPLINIEDNIEKTSHYVTI